LDGPWLRAEASRIIARYQFAKTKDSKRARGISMSSHLDRLNDWVSLARSARYRPDNLARLCSVSLRQLQRHFAARFGCAPRVWLDDLRLQEARTRLLAGEYVKALAFDLGFANAPHFCRSFKLRYGLSPLAFVAEHSQDVGRMQSMSPGCNPMDSESFLGKGRVTSTRTERFGPFEKGKN
jgi:AraC-like DNA-binding protein